MKTGVVLQKEFSLILFFFLARMFVAKKKSLQRNNVHGNVIPVGFHGLMGFSTKKTIVFSRAICCLLKTDIMENNSLNNL